MNFDVWSHQSGWDISGGRDNDIITPAGESWRVYHLDSDLITR